VEVTPTNIPEALVLTPRVFGDERGFFLESYNRQTFAKLGIDYEFVQDNHARSTGNVLRGLHYQIKQPQGKLVRVVAGEVFDVAVDLRRNSPTFGKWTGIYLTDKEKKLFWVPPGFAHGYFVLSDEAEFLYKTTDFYAPEHERCIRWDDPDLAIKWPISNGPPILSEKDKNGCLFKGAEYF
jgi:dTDP-4-dehydrorhamnose 3,5-epimerase